MRSLRTSSSGKVRNGGVVRGGEADMRVKGRWGRGWNTLWSLFCPPSPSPDPTPDMKWKNKFWGKSLEIVPVGTVNVSLPRWVSLRPQPMGLLRSAARPSLRAVFQAGVVR